MQVKAVLECDHLKLCAVLEKSSKELSFTAWEWNLLKVLVDILKPCGEATNLIQGEGSQSQCCGSICHHLEMLKPQDNFLSGMVRSLQASLSKRFLHQWPGHKMGSLLPLQTQSTSNQLPWTQLFLCCGWSPMCWSVVTSRHNELKVNITEFNVTFFLNLI